MMHDWHADVDLAMSLAGRLSEPDDPAAVAVRSRRVSLSANFYDPVLPPLSPEWSVQGRFLADDIYAAETVSFDASGRPLVSCSPAGETLRTWSYPDDQTVVRRTVRGRRAAVVMRSSSEGPVHTVSASPNGEVGVSVLVERSAATSRADAATWRSGRPPVAAAIESRLGPDGSVDQILVSSTRVMDEAPSAPILSALDGALRAAAQLTAEELVWNGRVVRAEPWPDDMAALVKTIASELASACIEAAAGAHPPPQVAVIQSDELVLPPEIRYLGGDQFAHGRAQGLDGYDVVVAAATESEPSLSGAALANRLGADSLRCCRAVNTALIVGASADERALARGLLRELARDLRRRLLDQTSLMPIVNLADHADLHWSTSFADTATNMGHATAHELVERLEELGRD
jgi:hypothetical protein